ncbi:MAG: nitrate ABC transporter ATP-binding protein, partial [Desulfosarcinaceae bacterium]
EMYPRLLFIYISHNVVEVARFCRQIWVLRDPAKTPQAVNVTGRDMRSDTPPDQEALQRTMLEIMNAV